MTDLTDRLDEIQARAEAATEGPWEADGTEITQHWTRPKPWATVASNEVACMAYCYGGYGRGIERETDAEFIAAARTDVPALVAALRAVLALHYGEPYAQGPDYCAECEHQWPCPTVRQIETALGAGDE